MKKKYKEFKSGKYIPNNEEKFGENAYIYRTSYELQLFKWCDSNPNILKVGYEKIVIPYICKTDNRLHKYYLDFFIIMKEKDKNVVYLIEVKPYRQTIPPVPSNRKKKTTILTENLNWLKNTSKWTSAKQYCQSKGYRWCILTEKGIYIDDKFYNGNILGNKK